MSGSTTPNYSFNLPTIGGNQDTWGNLLNANWTAADSAIHGLASGYLPLTGGALSGNLTVYGRIIWGNLGAGAHGMEFGWNGAVEAFVDGSFVGNLATQSYVSGGYMPLGGGLVTGDLAVNGNLSVGVRVITHDLMNNTGVFYVAGSAADYFARNTSDGAWRWVENNVVSLTLDVAGNLTARGTVHGTNVTAMADLIEELAARVADPEALRLA